MITCNLGAVHKGRQRRGWEGGCRNPDKLGYRGGGSYLTTRTSEFKKNKNKNNDKSKIAYIFKACWMSKGGEGSPNSDNDG